MDSGLYSSGSPKNFFRSKIVPGLVIIFAIFGVISLIMVITNYFGILSLSFLPTKYQQIDLTNPAVGYVRVGMETNLKKINQTPDGLELVTDLQDQGMPSFLLSEDAILSFASKSEPRKDIASASATDLKTGQKVSISIQYRPGATGTKQLRVVQVRILE